MSRQVIWTTEVLNAFIQEANLTDEEASIMRDHAAELSRVYISIKHHMSLASLDRRISRLKRKYDAAQRHSNVLPARQRGAKDLFSNSPGA